jgi:hypothetical protein
LTSGGGNGEVDDVGVSDADRRRRVLVPHALGADEFLRVTWHEQRRVVVFSHWQGDHCVAATPVRVSDLPELAELTAVALARSVARDSMWDPPSADEVVVLDGHVERSA